MTDPIFIPSEKQIHDAHLTHYINWLNQYKGLHFTNYESLWSWSVNEMATFWASLLDYFEVIFSGRFERVMSKDSMPGISWFEGLELNYAEHLSRHAELNPLAIIYQDEARFSKKVFWKEVLEQAARLQHLFESFNLVPGDRVAGYIHNGVEASESLFASIASGMVWSSASPDFGSATVIDRFRQIEPKILIAVDQYQYGGKIFDRTNEILEICQAIHSIECLVIISSNIGKYQHLDLEVHQWDQLSKSGDLRFTRVPFNHPMWIVYSSGTTGLPKAITHSQGGMLLEHLKYTHFHNNVKIGERYFWYTSTGWMMWNFIHATWLAGATIILYDGHPMIPDKDVLWKMAEQESIDHFGTSAPYIHSCMKDEIKIPNLPKLKSISSTGSPLSAEAYDWVSANFSKKIYLWSMSGGTDIGTAFVGGCPILPIYKGEIQCRALGCDLHVLDEDGGECEYEVGELVIEKPMPCMPIYFWNDADGQKYQHAYFDYFPRKWRHGDWINITEHHGLIIHGRSDTTLKRYGVRIGTSEIYSALSTIPEIQDSLIIHIDKDSGDPWMPLFIKLIEGHKLTGELINLIKSNIKSKCSPRHVPDDFFQVNDIPYTLSGKKMESLVKKIFQGVEPGTTSNLGTLKNPDSIDEFFKIKSTMN
ncbi:MAG: acetoacetate--CoA ligase [Saprospiraceae bacterium]